MMFCITEYYFINPHNVTLNTGRRAQYDNRYADVTGGFHDNTTNTLTVTDNYFPIAYNPAGQVNLPDKSISGTLTGVGTTFFVTYQDFDSN